MTAAQATTSTTIITAISHGKLTGWVLSGWSSCSETCGNGTRTRTMMCPTGVCFGSPHHANDPLSEACTNYDGCGQQQQQQQQNSNKSFTCPLGDSSLTCTTQLIIFLVAIPVVAFILLCLLAWCSCCRRKPREMPLQGGIYQIEDFGPTEFEVFYPIIDAPPKSDGDPDLESEYQQNIDESGKIHTVWHLDDETVRAYFLNFPQPMPDVLGMSDSPSDMLDNIRGLSAQDESVRDCVFDSCFRAAVSSEQTDASRVCVGLCEVMQAGTDFHLMYHDGCEVEYFSTTHKTWLPARVRANTKKVQDVSDSQTYVVSYDVALLGGRYQEKVQVPLYKLRAPLQIAEFVDVYSLRLGGNWLPGVIHGAQNAVPAITGYNILLTSTDGLVDKVPAARLRRRFPHGSAVLVYDGCTRGWCEAVVVQKSCAQNDAGALSIDNALIDTLGTPISLWVNMFVKFDATGETKSVPSYLILMRSRSCGVVSREGLYFAGVRPVLNPGSRLRPSMGPASEITDITELWMDDLSMEETS